MRLIIAASAILFLIGTTQALPTAVSCQERHQVVDGESCKTIAAKYHCTQSELQQWSQKLNNDQFDCNNIKAGDFICVKYSASKDKRDEKEDIKKPVTTTAPNKMKKAPVHHPITTFKPKKTLIHHSTNTKPTPSPDAYPPKKGDKKPIDKRGEKKKQEPKKKAHHPKKITTTKPHVRKPAAAPKKDDKEPIDKRDEKKEQEPKKTVHHPKKITTIKPHDRKPAAAPKNN